MKKLPLNFFKIPAFAGMTIAVFALTSCASVFEGTKQEVSLRTNPDVPANCTLTGSSFNVQVQAPGKFEVRKSYHPLEITCTPVAGGASGSVKLLSDVSATGYASAIFGVGIGAGVDTATGAAFKYPEEIVVTLGQTTILGQTSTNSNVDY